MFIVLLDLPEIRQHGDCLEWHGAVSFGWYILLITPIVFHLVMSVSYLTLQQHPLLFYSCDKGTILSLFLSFFSTKTIFEVARGKLKGKNNFICVCFMDALKFISGLSGWASMCSVHSVEDLLSWPWEPTNCPLSHVFSLNSLLSSRLTEPLLIETTAGNFQNHLKSILWKCLHLPP